MYLKIFNLVFPLPRWVRWYSPKFVDAFHPLQILCKPLLSRLWDVKDCLEKWPVETILHNFLHLDYLKVGFKRKAVVNIGVQRPVCRPRS